MPAARIAGVLALTLAASALTAVGVHWLLDKAAPMPTPAPTAEAAAPAVETVVKEAAAAMPPAKPSAEVAAAAAAADEAAEMASHDPLRLTAAPHPQKPQRALFRTPKS
jgi:hypothetical protein